MNQHLAFTIIFVAALFVSGANRTFAQTVAPGPYYATPSWDQTLPVNTRFIVLSNMNSDAVLDRETGLVWARSPSAKLIYEQASNACVNRKTGNRAGWRLPTVNELASLFDPAAPPLPAGHPFTGVPPIASLSVYFWSVTPAFNSTFHRLVGYELNNFSGVPTLLLGTSGNTGSDPGFANNYWCVRGGGPLSTPQ